LHNSWYRIANSQNKLVPLFTIPTFCNHFPENNCSLCDTFRQSAPAPLRRSLVFIMQKTLLQGARTHSLCLLTSSECAAYLLLLGVLASLPSTERLTDCLVEQKNSPYTSGIPICLSCLPASIDRLIRSRLNNATPPIDSRQQRVPSKSSRQFLLGSCDAEISELNNET
jgi:hypothetical protein